MRSPDASGAYMSIARSGPDEDVEAQPALGDHEQQDGFDDQRRGGGHGGAGRAEGWDQQETKDKIENESPRIDERADALLTQHIERRSTGPMAARARRPTARMNIRW